MIVIAQLSPRRWIAIDAAQPHGWRSTGRAAGDDATDTRGYQHANGLIIAGPADFTTVDTTVRAYEKRNGRLMTHAEFKQRVPE